MVNSKKDEKLTMHYTNKDIYNLDRTKRLKIINSVSGIKSANLIGTINNKGFSNVAVFSSVVHLGSNPPLVGFITRPKTKTVGHTLENINENKTYTINHITSAITKNAHYTSGKFPENISEFSRCGLQEEYIPNFKAPFVAESSFKMGLTLRETIDIAANGTTMVVGEIEHLIFPDSAMIDGDIDLEQTDGIGISGLNSYYGLKKIAKYPYVRLDEVPDFS